jgi:DASS family divalent anion:Na+ symporter
MSEEAKPEPIKVDAPALPPKVAWALMIGLGVAIWLAAAAHEGTLANPEYTPSKWRLLAIFLPTILGLMLRPMPGGAIVLIGVVLTALLGALTLDEALAGYMDSTVWLVLAAYFISRGFIKTGLARRIALMFVRFMGRTTLGLAYAILATDTLLAGMIPSNAARVGGVLLPITRGLAELYKSHPGRSASLIGTFLMLSLYQGDVIACALFFTGQASNPLAAEQARQLTANEPGGPLVLTYANWIWYALAPAVVSLLAVPYLVYRWNPPEVTETPAAAEFANDQLIEMGPPSRNERMLIAVFCTVVLSWILVGSPLWVMVQDAVQESGLIMPDRSKMTALIALSGACLLLLTGVITWEDAVTERAAWDVFIWYGGLVQLGLMLNRTQLLTDFANQIVGPVGHWHWVPLFVGCLLIYFYAHYAFASITVHLVAMYPAFVGVVIAAGAPPFLVAASFAFFANFSAGLTHYGTTPAPIIFSLGYVPQGTWWRMGFWLSVVHIIIWLTIGMAWWKLTGLW